eukprot:134014_1
MTDIYRRILAQNRSGDNNNEPPTAVEYITHRINWKQIVAFVLGLIMIYKSCKERKLTFRLSWLFLLPLWSDNSNVNSMRKRDDSLFTLGLWLIGYAFTNQMGNAIVLYTQNEQRISQRQTEMLSVVLNTLATIILKFVK